MGKILNNISNTHLNRNLINVKLLEKKNQKCVTSINKIDIFS